MANIYIKEWKKGNYPYKYQVILSNDKKVNFGNVNYQHYKDKTPLKLYSNLNHYDKLRRRNYKRRHEGIITKDNKKAIDIIYSPAWFSYNYLW